MSDPTYNPDDLRATFLGESTEWNPRTDPVYVRALRHEWNHVSSKGYFFFKTAQCVREETSIRLLRRLDDVITKAMSPEGTRLDCLAALVGYVENTYRDFPDFESIQADIQERLVFLRRLVDYHHFDNDFSRLEQEMYELQAGWNLKNLSFIYNELSSIVYTMDIGYKKWFVEKFFPITRANMSV